MDPTQLIIQLAVGGGMGFLISAMSVLGDTNNKWSNRLFAYTAILGAFSAFAVIESVGAVTEANLISVLLMIGGATFFANKGIKVAERARLAKK